METNIVTINVGSSSVKVAVYSEKESGELERFAFNNFQKLITPGTHRDQSHAASEDVFKPVSEWLMKSLSAEAISAVGHRIVHGGNEFHHTTWINEEALHRLSNCIPLAPNHLVGEIEWIRYFQEKFPNIPQAACFDTAFHSTLPRIASLLPIPRYLQSQGMHRYGFHGLSYSYLMTELHRLGGDEAAHGRLILAHLGHGASMAAVYQGKCLDTSMSFTPTGGLVMGTRTGDIDPGVLLFLLKERQLTVEQLEQLVTRESGLLGVSESSSDMRDLLSRRKIDSRADDAISLFCYDAKKQIGAYFAALSGLDTLVFTGGVGEHAAEIRHEICRHLECLGIRLDQHKNAGHTDMISSSDSSVSVRIIPSNEELMIARDVLKLLKSNHGQ